MTDCLSNPVLNYPSVKYEMAPLLEFTIIAKEGKDSINCIIM